MHSIAENKKGKLKKMQSPAMPKQEDVPLDKEPRVGDLADHQQRMASSIARVVRATEEMTLGAEINPTAFSSSHEQQVAVPGVKDVRINSAENPVNTDSQLGLLSVYDLEQPVPGKYKYARSTRHTTNDPSKVSFDTGGHEYETRASVSRVTGLLRKRDTPIAEISAGQGRGYKTIQETNRHGDTVVTRRLSVLATGAEAPRVEVIQRTIRKGKVVKERSWVVDPSKIPDSENEIISQEAARRVVDGMVSRALASTDSESHTFYHPLAEGKTPGANNWARKKIYRAGKITGAKERSHKLNNSGIATNHPAPGSW